MPSVRAVDISKRFGDFTAVNHIDLKVKDGEFVTLLGPSGCGKTTALRIIAGLITPDTGDVYFDEERVTDLPPHKRNIGYVFQRIALFPHMNVYKNITFGLKMRHWPKREIDGIVKRVLKMVHMEGYERRMTSKLSGGEAQRIEIARVLAPDPEVLLFDEPLSNLDAKLRDELKYEIRRIQEETGKTMIFVTHDQAEAFAISDRIYVMSQGSFEQIGKPVDLYLSPTTPFVAGFIGSNNFVPGTISSMDPSSSTAKVLAEELEIQAPCGRGLDLDDKVLVCIRPEDISILSKEDRDKFVNVFKGKVQESIFAGSITRLNVDVKGVLLKVDIQGPERFSRLHAEGEEVFLGFNQCSLIKTRG